MYTSVLPGMDVRGKVRGIFADYDDYRDVHANYDKINEKIATMVLATFKENGVPPAGSKHPAKQCESGSGVVDRRKQKGVGVGRSIPSSISKRNIQTLCAAGSRGGRWFCRRSQSQRVCFAQSFSLPLSPKATTMPVREKQTAKLTPLPSFLGRRNSRILPLIPIDTSALIHGTC
jgi:hypothetical protein